MKEISRQPDILTVYFGADEGSAYKIDTVVDTLNAIRELYDCFSLLCYGEKQIKIEVPFASRQAVSKSSMVFL